MSATPARTSKPMQAQRVPNSPKSAGNGRPLNQLLIARYPPTPMSAVIRSASYEALGSRGVSPVPMAAVPVYHTTSLASPPLSHRSGTDSARGPGPGPGARVQAVPRRFPSRSPPPQRSATEASLHQRPPSRHATPRGFEPVATRAMSTTAIHPMQVAPAAATQSTQSLPSAQSLGSGGSVHLGGPSFVPPVVATMPAARAMSASSLPSGHGIPVAVQTLTAAPQPPWATVIAPLPRPDDTDLRAKLDQIQQEVRTVSLRQLEQGNGESLEHTRQRLNEIVSQQQQLIQPQPDKGATEKDQQKMEELFAQLAQKDHKLTEVEQKLQNAVAELGQQKTDLDRVREEYHATLAAKRQLEGEQRTRNVQSDAAAEQLRARCDELERSNTELERSVLDLQERVRVLSSMKATLETQAGEHGERERRLAESARRMEGEKRLVEARNEQLAAELENARTQIDQHREALDQHREVEQETRELRCCTAVLEDQLRDAQERRQRAEQEQQRAETDLRQWYQKFLEANKENSALQRTNEAQVKQLWSLEQQLVQERNVSNICTPGEYLRLAKAHEDHSLAAENSRLKKVVTKLQCEVDLCVRKLSEQEALLKEYQEGNKRFQG